MSLTKLFKFREFFSQYTQSKLRDWFNPIQFPNQLTRYNKIEQYTPLNIKNIIEKKTQVHPYIYVILPDGNLVISEQTLLFEQGIGGPIFSGRTPHHPSLAKLGPVISAGEVFILVHQEKAIIDKITNDSGHYIPVGEHLAALTESIFENHGFAETKGKYKVSDYIGADPTARELQPIRPRWNPKFFANLVTQSLLKNRIIDHLAEEPISNRY